MGGSSSIAAAHTDPAGTATHPRKQIVPELNPVQAAKAQAWVDTHSVNIMRVESRDISNISPLKEPPVHAGVSPPRAKVRSPSGSPMTVLMDEDGALVSDQLKSEKADVTTRLGEPLQPPNSPTPSFRRRRPTQSYASYTLRQDLATLDWVVLAPDRLKHQPLQTDLNEPLEKAYPAYTESCPFCPRNEPRFPHNEVDYYPHPHPGNEHGSPWLVRVVENKYRIVEGGSDHLRPRTLAPFTQDGPYKCTAGHGHHELVWETPQHNLTIATMPYEAVEQVLRLYVRRFIALAKIPNTLYTIIFKNHGPKAGASQPHAHSQIVGMRVVPNWIRFQMDQARRHYDRTGQCVVCAMIEHELEDRSRVVFETEYFVTIVPFASSVPYNIEILPKTHAATFRALTDEEFKDFAICMKDSLLCLYNLLSNPDFNYVIHNAPYGLPNLHDFHWHVAIVPHTGLVAGFELGTGMHVNFIRPEDAARQLREAYNRLPGHRQVPWLPKLPTSGLSRTTTVFSPSQTFAKMPSTVLRQDLASRSWVVVAPARLKGRPLQSTLNPFLEDCEPNQSPTCPFCPTNGAKYPQNEVCRIEDHREAVSPGSTPPWLARCILNKYRIVDDAQEGTQGSMPSTAFRQDGIYRFSVSRANGHHEVVIESPVHNHTLATMPLASVHAVVRIYRQRLQEFANNPANLMTIIFKNHGVRAGTSLTHPHSQIVALRVIPNSIRTVIDESQRYFDMHGCCVWCQILTYERGCMARIVLESTFFVALTPYAAQVPFEVQILPKHHSSSMTDLLDEELEDFADILKEVMRRLHVTLHNPDFNYIFFNAPYYLEGSPAFHWHVSILPHTSNTAGFELGTRIRVNVMAPEACAAQLAVAAK
uniref:HIT domain-containing protein n=1 Tax=Eutreptiella gymnastica TaxID=73025 RepID=A0A7S1I492_9EUGL|mmetsp:Transcript_128593/g.222142  ORF Transcript_128593/g.222142 Transcript_128593/m.222142 type:complete len:872 (+) Transcript_128593:54-2669(+)